MVKDESESLNRQLARAVATVQQGGLIAYPTEAVFGLGCDPAQLASVRRLLVLKQRSVDKGLILIAADLAQLVDYLEPLSEALLTQVKATWPGPVTWLLPAKASVSPLIRGAHDSIAVRVSAHAVCRALCERLGHPLISTSANPSNRPPARDAAMVKAYFGVQVDYLLDLPTGGHAQPSEIRDGRSGAIIRSSAEKIS